jgi:hypothetical protein
MKIEINIFVKHIFFDQNYKTFISVIFSLDIKDSPFSLFILLNNEAIENIVYT